LETSSGNGANPLHDYCYNPVFWEKGRFNQEKTVQFSGPVLVAKNRQSDCPSGNPPWPGAPLWSKNKGGSLWEKMTRFFRANHPGFAPFILISGK
jgi:hypothetical protein